MLHTAALTPSIISALCMLDSPKRSFSSSMVRSSRWQSKSDLPASRSASISLRLAASSRA